MSRTLFDMHSQLDFSFIILIIEYYSTILNENSTNSKENSATFTSRTHKFVFNCAKVVDVSPKSAQPRVRNDILPCHFSSWQNWAYGFNELGANLTESWQFIGMDSWVNEFAGMVSERIRLSKTFSGDFWFLILFSWRTRMMVIVKRMVIANHRKIRSHEVGPLVGGSRGSGSGKADASTWTFLPSI